MKGTVLPWLREFSVPLDVVTETLAFLGRKRGGKTYSAGRLIECMIREARAQVVVLDLVGNWFNLRTDASGTGPGLDVVVLGGRHGDIPITVHAAAAIADLVVDTGRCVVVDISPFSTEERAAFCSAFFRRLWERKKAEDQPVPLHVVVEEAHLVAPQESESKADYRSRKILEEVVRLGGNFGIGVSLISQRPQEVHKSLLSQVGTLVVFEMMGEQERKAIAKWVVQADADQNPVNLTRELAKLPIGEAYLYSPRWLQRFEKVHATTKTTFDGSATPKPGDPKRARVMRPVDLNAVKTAMSEALAEAQNNDPQYLQAECAKWRTMAEQAAARAEQAEEAIKHVPPPPPLTDLAPFRAAIAKMEAVLLAKAKEARGWGDYMEEVRSQVLDGLERTLIIPATSAPAIRTPVPISRHDTIRSTVRMASVPMGAGKFSISARAMEALLLIRYATDYLRAPASVDWLAVHMGMRVSGGFNNYLYELSGALFVDRHNGVMEITELGHQACGSRVIPTPPSTERVLQLWLPPKVSAKSHQILRHLLEIHPKYLTIEGAAKLVDMKVSGGFNNHLYALSGANLVTRTRGELRVSKWIINPFNGG